jgi:hypothetical protein
MTTKQLQAAEVDEFVILDTELAPFKSKIRRRDDLRKLIGARYENEDPNGTFIAQGNVSSAKVSPRTMRRDFKPGAMEKFAAFLGKVFFKLAKVSMEDFDNHVTILDREKFVVQSQTGYRYVNAIAKAEVKRAA